MASRRVSSKDFKHIKVTLPDNYELLVASLESSDGKTCKLELSNGLPLVTQTLTFGNAKSKAEMIETLRPHLPKVEKHAWEEYFAVLDTGVQTEIESLLADGDEELGDDSGRKSQAVRLIELAEASDAIFFHDQLGDSYCATKGDGREVLKIRSKKFRLWLRQLMWQAEKKAPGGQGIEDALGHLDGKAIFEGDEIALEVRVAWRDGVLWYDLGEEAIKITKAGWSVVVEPPILFKRFKANSPQVAPVKGGNIGDFLTFTRVKADRDKLLLLVQLAASFIPGFPQAAQVLSGDQGAAKTTLQEFFKAVVDPSEVLTLSPPDAVKDFVQQASHHWVLFYDNLSSMPRWLSDCLCKAVTGQGFSKRELYSDDEDVLYAFRRVVGLNAINLVVERPDLLDRSLLIHLERVPDDERRELTELRTAFDQAKPRILGGIFDVLVKAMAIHPTLRLTSLPRMADFSKWGEAIAQVIGYESGEFTKAYAGNVVAQNEVALEASPVAQAIITLAGERTGEIFQGAPSDLLAALVPVAEGLKLDLRSKAWPKDARWLWRRIAEVRPNLMAVGIVAERDDSDKTHRKISLTRIIPKNDTPNARVACGQQKQQLPAGNIKEDDACQATDDAQSGNTEENDARYKSLETKGAGNTGNIGNVIPSRPSDEGAYDEGAV